MISKALTLGGLDGTRLGRQITFQKGFKAALSDEADARTIPFSGIIKARRLRQSTHLGFLKAANRKQGFLELFWA